MKKFLLILGLTITIFNVHSQNIPILDGKYTFSEVIEFPEMTAKQINDKAKDFLIVFHSDSSFLVDSGDKLIDNGSFPVNFKMRNIPMTYIIRYNLISEFKDNKNRITISDFKVTTNAAGTTSELPLENFIENLNSVGRGKGYAEKMLEQIEESIEKESKGILIQYKESFSSTEKSW